MRHPTDGEKSDVDETGDRHSEEHTPEHDGHKEEEDALVQHPADGEKSGVDETADGHKEEDVHSEQSKRDGHGHKEEEVLSEQSECDGHNEQQTPERDGHKEEEVLSEQSKRDRHNEQQTPERDGHKEEEVLSKQSERDGHSEQQTPSEHDGHKQENCNGSVTDSSTSDTTVVSDSSVVVLSDHKAKHEVELIVLSSDVEDTDAKCDGQKEVKEESPDKSKVTSTQTKLEITDFPPQGRLESRSKYICHLSRTLKGNKYSYKKNKNIKRGSSTTSSSSENERDGHKKTGNDGSTSSGSH